MIYERSLLETLLLRRLGLGVGAPFPHQAQEKLKTYVDVFEDYEHDGARKPLLTRSMAAVEDLHLTVAASFLLRFLTRDADARTTRRGCQATIKDLPTALYERLHPTLKRRTGLAITMKL